MCSKDLAINLSTTFMAVKDVDSQQEENSQKRG